MHTQLPSSNISHTLVSKSFHNYMHEPKMLVQTMQKKLTEKNMRQTVDSRIVLDYKPHSHYFRSSSSSKLNTHEEFEEDKVSEEVSEAEELQIEETKRNI